MNHLKTLHFVVAFLFSCTVVTVYGQSDGGDKPQADLKTPYDAMYTHLYYLQAEHSNQKDLAARPFYAIKKDDGTIEVAAEELAQKLKQIWDGKGIRVALSMIPEDPNFMDSISKKNVYIPFPKEFPQIYLEKNKLSSKWYFSHETSREIPKIHKQVYPFGSHYLLDVLPHFGGQRFLGLALWQYLGLLILGGLGFLVHFFASRIFIFIIRIIANSRLGKGHFDQDILRKVARILSYIVVLSLISTFVPVLQLPISFGFYLVLVLKLLTTFFVVLLALRTIAFFRSYLEILTQRTATTTDEHLLPIIIRIVNVVVIGAGVIHVLSIFDVNVTALVAGLSLGGLAIALAAQETLRNLLGSMMLYADRPFKIGDFVTVGAVSGTVVDIGFRSTRIKTPDTSIVSVPNGNLMNETVNNLGERDLRRFSTSIGVAYHTPPDLIEIFIQGLREMIVAHPNTDSQNYYIHLNNMGGSSLDILFIVYFDTSDWSVELHWKEEVIFAILRLAESLGVQIAFPSTSVYLETMPERKPMVPTYQEEMKDAENRLKAYMDEFRHKFKTEERVDGSNLSKDKTNESLEE